MENNNLWAVVGVALIVAIVASVATVAVTGNIIKVPTSVATTQADIYTKAEVDTLIKGISMKQSTLNCSKSGGFADTETGNTVCAKEGKACLIGLNYARMYNKNQTVIYPMHLTVMNCNQNQVSYTETRLGYQVDKDLSWICCKS